MAASRKFSTIVATTIVIVVVLASGASAESLNVREALLRDITRVIVGADAPVKKPDGSWNGVVLAPAGTPISPLLTSWENQRLDLGSVGQQLEAIKLYDQALLVRDGVAFSLDIQLADTWEQIISRCRPPLDAKKAPSEEVYKLLFRIPDKIDQLKGVQFLQVPSDEYRRYAEYRSLMQLLINAEQNNDSLWRLHPRLSVFTSLAEAHRTIQDEWNRFGFRQEIEAAEAEYLRVNSEDRWKVWTDAHLRFSTLSYTSSSGITVPRTVLFPSPELWMSMGSWITMHSDLGPAEGDYAFQLARVSISRPWMEVGRLLAGEIQFRQDPGGGTEILISDGQNPTLLQYPQGRLAVLPEQLLLVRRIRVRQEAPKADNPLSRFAFPDEINLFGYVVRALPKIP